MANRPYTPEETALANAVFSAHVQPNVIRLSTEQLLRSELSESIDSGCSIEVEFYVSPTSKLAKLNIGDAAELIVDVYDDVVERSINGSVTAKNLCASVENALTGLISIRANTFYTKATSKVITPVSGIAVPRCLVSSVFDTP